VCVCVCVCVCEYDLKLRQYKYICDWMKGWKINSYIYYYPSDQYCVLQGNIHHCTFHRKCWARRALRLARWAASQALVPGAVTIVIRPVVAAVAFDPISACIVHTKFHIELALHDWSIVDDDGGDSFWTTRSSICNGVCIACRMISSLE
jgi:hypothetical protein